MDISTIATTVTASATAVDSIAKLVKSVREILAPGKLSDADVQSLKAKVADLFDVAIAAKSAQLDLQQAVFALQAEKDALKSKVAEMEAFDAHVVDYELCTIAPNSFAYLKKGTPKKMGETPYLCVSCFDQRQKSLLQFVARDFHFDTLKCPKCGTTARIHNGNEPTIATSGSRPNWDFDPFGD